MWERLAVLGHLADTLKNSKTEVGKTKVQKLVFLMEELERIPLNYKFHFYNYGPYSNSLASDIGYLQGFGALNVDFDSQSGAFHIIPGDQNKDLMDRGRAFLETNSSSVSRIIETFGSKSARDLELLSTIVYVANRDPEYSPDDEERLVNVTKALKPRFSAEEIQKSAQLLKDNGYLGAAA